MKSSSNKVRVFYILMILIAIALNIKYIFIDFGVDSEFQISMSYRLAKGDIMFKEMWEPYQMSAFLCTFFIKIYLNLFNTTTGIVLFLQIIGVFIDALISYFVYWTVRHFFKCEKVAFWMSWLFFIVSPKDVPIADYTNMQMWFSMLLILTLFVYFKTGRLSMLVVSALFLCGTILSYFSCIIIFFGVALLIFIYGRRKHLWVFIGTCMAAGIMYLLFIFSQISINDFFYIVKNILILETSHSAGILEKFIFYFKDFINYGIVFIILYIIAFLCTKLLSIKIKELQNKECSVILSDLLFCFLVLIISLYTVIFWEDYVRYSYSLSFLGIIVIGFHHKNKLSKDTHLFYVCATVISVLQFFATLLLTNLVLTASVPYLLIAVMAAFLPISEAIKLFDNKTILQSIKMILLFGGLIFIVFRNIYIIRPMCGYVNTILNVNGIIKSGPAIGIMSEYMGPYIQNESMKEWQQYIKEGDAIYLIGGELDTLGYLYADTEISAPSLVPTPGYNESVMKYWEMNPDKYPDVIIASCWYGNLNSTLIENEWILKWIEEEFNPRYYVDGKYWRYYFR